jgi:DNA repair photolyase
VLVRNPMNRNQVRRVSLRPKDVDGVVFWTKNPEPLLGKLDAFRDYAYYFQFTLTGYDREVEMNLPSHERRLETFLRLSEMIGPERVLWRYDPILLSRKYTVDWHLETFHRYAERLKGATRRATISFVDTYSRNKKRLEALQSLEIDEETMRTMAWEISAIARLNGMQAVACAEETELIDCGVGPASCVDAELLSRISGKALNAGKDSNQREACGCAASVDIGAYNTCPNGCLYCYANYSPALLNTNLAKRDDHSPILCDHPTGADQITERKLPSLKDAQIRMEF